MTELFVVPELTRAMRAFASPHALGEAHDKYFAPLLDARRGASKATRWQSRVSAFDADRVEATTRAIIGTFASERFPDRAPDRRALTARLEDACAEMFSALDVLRRAQSAVNEAIDDSIRAGAWQAWVDALRSVFVAADRGWERIEPMLGTLSVARQRRGARKRR